MYLWLWPSCQLFLYKKSPSFVPFILKNTISILHWRILHTVHLVTLASTITKIIRRMLRQLLLLLPVLLALLQPGRLQEPLSSQLAQLQSSLDVIEGYLESDPSLPIHNCGGTGGWRRVVYLNMTDPTTSCPCGWNLTDYSRRTCGKVARGGFFICHSATFPVSGGQYSKVCGRIKAYQWGRTDAFWSYHNDRVNTIDRAYMDGVSVTHGSPRQHIWTFASGASEGNPTQTWVCPCDASNDISVPPFVGDDYFCESGINRPFGGGADLTLQPNDILWDGQDCLPSSTCCSLNNPPYFVKKLPASTTDDLEARICLKNIFTRSEDVAVELVELYVQ